MKTISMYLIIILFLTACSPSVGVGVGVAGVSNVGSNSIAGTEIIADSETGVHGSIVMGSDIRL